MSATTQNTPGTGPGTSRRAVITLVAIAAVAAIGLVVLVAWAVWTASSRPAPTRAPDFARFEPAWSSAMAKAGVEAVFPGGPVDLIEVRPTGRHAFESSFTAEEVSALLNVYRFEMDYGGATFEIGEATVGFPEDGVASVAGKILSGGSAYGAEATAPLVYSAKGISSAGLSDLSVEGFSVGGERRDQAGQALLAYLNSYLRAAPGLTVERAEIVGGELHVTGSAPTTLEHPGSGE